MKTIIKRNLGEVIIILFLHATVCLFGQDNSKLDYYGFFGLQRSIVDKDARIIDHNRVIDPVYLYSDSIRFLPSFSFHAGTGLSVNVIWDLYLNFEIQCNLRKSYIKLYGDTTLSTGITIPGYNLKHDLYYNAEFPIYFLYKFERFGLGAGLTFTLFELRFKRLYLDTNLRSKNTEYAIFPKLLEPRFLYPNIYAEYLIFKREKYPIWIRASYEFVESNSSLLYITLKTKLNWKN